MDQELGLRSTTPRGSGRDQGSPTHRPSNQERRRVLVPDSDESEIKPRDVSRPKRRVSPRESSGRREKVEDSQVAEIGSLRSGVPQLFGVKSKVT